MAKSRGCENENERTHEDTSNFKCAQHQKSDRYFALKVMITVQLWKSITGRVFSIGSSSAVKKLGLRKCSIELSCDGTESTDADQTSVCLCVVTRDWEATVTL